MYGSPLATSIISKKDSNLSVGTKDLVDSKFDLNSDGKWDLWTIEHRTLFLVIDLTGKSRFKYRVFKKIGKDLVASEVKRGSKASADTIQSWKIRMSPMMKSDVEDDPRCINQGPVFDVLGDLNRIISVALTSETIESGCQTLDVNTRRLIQEQIEQRLQNDFKECLAEVAHRNKMSSGIASNLQVSLSRLGQESGSPKFQCTTLSRNGPVAVSDFPPFMLAVNLDSRKLKSSADWLDHEIVHLVFLKSCLASLDILTCKEFSNSEDKVDLVTQELRQCVTDNDNNRAVGAPVAVSASVSGQVLSKSVGGDLGAPLATIPIEPIVPSSVNAEIQSLAAYVKASDQASPKVVAVIAERTEQMAQPVLERAERAMQQVGELIGNSVVPAAQAEVRAPSRTGLSERRDRDEGPVERPRTSAAADDSPEVQRRPLAVDRAPLYIPQRPEMDLGAKSGASAVVKGDLGVEPVGPQRNELKPTDREAKGGTVASSGEPTVAGRNSSAPASLGGGAVARGAAPRTAASGGASQRAPAAIPPNQVTPEVVESEIRSLPGKDVLARLKDERYERIVKDRLGISISDNSGRVWGVKDAHLARTCAVIRDLNKKITGTNCPRRTEAP